MTGRNDRTSVGTSAADLVAEAVQILRDAGIEQARLEARWLLAHVLNISESSLLAHPDAAIDPDGASHYHQAVRRRARREPFAYIVGEREFYGRAFVVDHDVLVPRPETEILVAEALAVLKVRTFMSSQSPLVVDVGTGSGAIACVLAGELPSAHVFASDVSSEALAVAALNRDRLGLRDRLQLVRGNLLGWLRQPADLVVANLPYIPSARLPTLMPEVAEWEPRQALDGGPDGLDVVRALLTDARRVVRPGGTILLELDPEQMDPARALQPGAASTVIRDLAGLNRFLRLDLP